MHWLVLQHLRRPRCCLRSLAKAAAPVVDKQNASFYRYKVGDAEVTVVSDGSTTFPLGDSFILNAKKDEVNAALRESLSSARHGDDLTSDRWSSIPAASWW